MTDRSMFQNARIVLVVGIVAILIGILVPDESSASPFFRGVGVLITLIGMVSMIAVRQNETISSPINKTTDPYSQPES